MLRQAVEGPAFQWIANIPQCQTAGILSAAGLPPELADSSQALLSYLAQLHQGTGHRRASLIVVGYQGAGKSSLVWRLQHTGADFPSLTTTDGIDTSNDC